MNRWKRRRKPKAKTMQPTKAQKRRALIPATGGAGGYLQYYGARRQGKSVFAAKYNEYVQQLGRGVRLHKKELVPQIEGIDYAAIEAAAMAHLDPQTIDSLSKMGDYHRESAAKDLGVDYADVTDEQRRIAKARNFFACYGGSEWPPVTNQLAPGEQNDLMSQIAGDEFSGSVTARLKGPADE